MTDASQTPHMASTLIEALPYLKRHRGATFVIKYGGHAMGDERLARDFARDIVLLKHTGINPIVVHGGGPQIRHMLGRLKIESEFIDGLRVTDADTVEVVEMVLAGKINKEIVGAIQAEGGMAVGICGKDARLITAEQVTRNGRDIGYVGQPVDVDRTVLDVFDKTEIIPVIAPVAASADGQTLNINADTAAGAIAGAINARRLLMLTDVEGVLDKAGQLMPWLMVDAIPAMIADGTISGGMIPKVETCVAAVDAGARAATILDGRVPHALLLELFTEHGIGTQIRKDSAPIVRAQTN